MESLWEYWSKLGDRDLLLHIKLDIARTYGAVSPFYLVLKAYFHRTIQFPPNV